MEIKFRFRGRNIAISIGHETPWFSQLPFIMVTEEFYFNKSIDYARVLWRI